VGKHEVGFERVERDAYNTPPWCVEALAQHVELADLEIWEPAAGNGQMVGALKGAGASVHATDIHQYGGFKLDKVLDFTSGMHRAKPFDAIITNPPYGLRAKLAEQFVEIGLHHIARDGGFLALLLPIDFDAAKSRRHLLGGSTYFAGKIVLTRRIVWFANPEKREAPKENHAWHVWAARSAIRWRLRKQQPIIHYAPRISECSS
jgi:hypothetical protein